jgi:hypothetical protein
VSDDHAILTATAGYDYTAIRDYTRYYGCVNIFIIDDAEQEMAEVFNTKIVVEDFYSMYRCTPVPIRITDNDGIVVSCCTISQGFLCGWFLSIIMCMEKLHRFMASI